MLSFIYEAQKSRSLHNTTEALDFRSRLLRAKTLFPVGKMSIKSSFSSVNQGLELSKTNEVLVWHSDNLLFGSEFTTTKPGSSWKSFPRFLCSCGRSRAFVLPARFLVGVDVVGVFWYQPDFLLHLKTSKLKIVISCWIKDSCNSFLHSPIWTVSGALYLEWCWCRLLVWLPTWWSLQILGSF